MRRKESLSLFCLLVAARWDLASLPLKFKNCGKADRLQGCRVGMAAAMQPLWSVLFNREAFYRDTGHKCDVTALATCFIF